MTQRPDRLGRLVPAGVLGCIAFVLIGWSGLLVPSLIRSVKTAFEQSDAGIGGFYFLFAGAYALGSLGGGILTERFGRRVVLSFTAGLHAAALVALALAPSWGVFLVAAIPLGFGGGALDGGVNGLYLDLFRTGRGRALNLLHVFFSLGALSAPLVVGRAVSIGVDWRAILLGTGLVAIPVAVLFATVAMPDGRRARDGTGAGGDAGTATPTAYRGVGPLGALRDRLAAPIILLGVAIACYVASEVGVSNWLVRFLEPAPLSDATTGLALFWAGLTAGRLVSARLADRYDHLRFATVSVLAMTLAMLGAILVPSIPLSIALFALTGFASGPIYPMIVAIGGDRYPERSAAIGGFLSGVAVAGSVVYPPLMGVLSVTVGLTVAMLGNVLLGLACAAALMWVGRLRPHPS